MKVVDRSFPYPVLSPLRDDVSPNRFDLTCKCRSDAWGYYLSYSFGHDNDTIKALVESGSATYAVHIECRSCFYRVLHPAPTETGTIELAADDVAGVLEVSGFVVAKRDIVEYALPDAHADYGKAKFTVRAGDLIATSRTLTFEAEKEFDPLKKVSSIIQVLPGESDEGPFTVDMEGGKISVFLSKQDYKRYGEARLDPALASSLIQGIVLPVLIIGIIEVGERTNAEQPLPRWGEIVKQRLSDMGHEINQGSEKSLAFAQKLLQDPTTRFLRDILKLTGDNSNEA